VSAPLERLAGFEAEARQVCAGSTLGGGAGVQTWGFSLVPNRFFASEPFPAKLRPGARP